MTATADMEGQQAKPVSAAAAGSIVEQPPQDDDNEARKKSAVTIAVYFGTVLQLKYAAESLADHGDEPALLVLELSTWLSFLLYLWAVYVARVLVSTDHRRLGVRPLLAVLAAIVAAVVASVLAYTVISAVVGMVLMYLVTLCVAGFFAWCLNDYLRTRNSAGTVSTSATCQEEKKPVTTSSAPDESKEALLQKKSSSKPNLNVGDLEAGFLLSPGA